MDIKMHSKKQNEQHDGRNTASIFIYDTLTIKKRKRFKSPLKGIKKKGRKRNKKNGENPNKNKQQPKTT